MHTLVAIVAVTAALLLSACQSSMAEPRAQSTVVNPFRLTARSITDDNVGGAFEGTLEPTIQLRTFPMALRGQWTADASRISVSGSQTLILGHGPVDLLRIEPGEGRDRNYDDLNEAVADGAKKGRIAVLNQKFDPFSVTHINYLVKSHVMSVIAQRLRPSSTETETLRLWIHLPEQLGLYQTGPTFTLTFDNSTRLTASPELSLPMSFDLASAQRLFEEHRRN